MSIVMLSQSAKIMLRYNSSRLSCDRASVDCSVSLPLASCQGDPEVVDLLSHEYMRFCLLEFRNTGHLDQILINLAWWKVLMRRNVISNLICHLKLPRFSMTNMFVDYCWDA
ncbi:hypothetical protein V1524DRAFT_423925 [Lipomyces starkeyi]